MAQTKFNISWIFLGIFFSDFFLRILCKKKNVNEFEKKIMFFRRRICPKKMKILSVEKIGKLLLHMIQNIALLLGLKNPFWSLLGGVGILFSPGLTQKKKIFIKKINLNFDVTKQSLLKYFPPRKFCNGAQMHIKAL